MKNMKRSLITHKFTWEWKPSVIIYTMIYNHVNNYHIHFISIDLIYLEITIYVSYNIDRLK